MPSLSAQAQLDQLVSTCGEPPMSSTRIVGESYSRARCGRGIQHGRWQRFGFEIGSRTEVVSHEERKFWFARIEAMGRLDHAGGVVFLHLSRGRGVTATTPVAQRVEVVGLRGGKEQGKGRDHYMAFPFVGRPELPFMWAFEQTGMADGTVGVLVSSLSR